LTKKFILVALTLMLMSATARASSMCADLVTLADYITAHSCDVATGATFSNFSWTGPVSGQPGGISNGSSFSIPAEAVYVSVINVPGGPFGLVFSSSFFDKIAPGTSISGRAVAGSLNINLAYTLTLQDTYGRVDGVSAAVSGFHHTGTSSMSFNTTESDQSDPSNVVTLYMNENSTFSSDLFIPKVQAIDIVEYVGLTALRGTSDVIGFTSFDDTFSVPEPMTTLLLGSGLLALGLAGRRIRAR